ncbi:RNA-dependent RNA polymerase [Wenzhou qinvirus-like virus 2]|uniref:RNA-dependent RNA polymerase n=1 Tax=Wenzhou qinvirus-like virus 2 TaxID=1923648 RepID=A0A1L3KL01_9VIRU|nr:RNA-dependent RNA polymerase [Wenzhou qinvirus-like virus 2]APG78077.1 RNA-dependent RNA polymerase [Wenzhou qinvirus-like virus 2]
MARVFEKPRYFMQSEYLLGAAPSLATEEGFDSASLSSVFGAEIFGAEWVKDPTDEEYVSQAVRRHTAAKPMERIYREHFVLSKIRKEAILTASTVFYDDLAAYALVSAALSGTITADEGAYARLLGRPDIAKEIFLFGCIGNHMDIRSTVDMAGFLEPVFKPLRYWRAKDKLALSCGVIAKALHDGLTDSKCRDTCRRFVNGAGTADSVVIRADRCAAVRMVNTIGVYMYAGQYVIRFVRNGKLVACVTDRPGISQAAECLRAVWGTSLYVSTYRASVMEGQPNRAVEWMWRDIRRYMSAELQRRLYGMERPHVRCLARHMKSSYAQAMMVLGDHDWAESQALPRITADLVSETAEHLHGGPSYFDILRPHPLNMVMDIGTAWNMLPAPDADPRKLFHKLVLAMDAPRRHIRGEFTSFIRYACLYLSATLLAMHPDAPCEWESWDGEVVSDDTAVAHATEMATEDRDNWITECRKGRLYQAPGGFPYRVTKIIAWHKRIEFWHHTAHDVTHVYADKSLYSTVMGVTSAGYGLESEIEYVLHYGPTLSGKFTAQDVRMAAASGTLPGDRVLYVAAKSENTKFGDKVRDTHSADDITRELLSEVDYNIARIADLVPGTVSRASPAKVERNMEILVGQAGTNDVLVSLDVDGWSPNMDKRVEMGFLKMLMGFFKDTPMDDPSIWRDGMVLVVNRLGFHGTHLPRDGSFQGFFGSTDSLLNAMAAQWAFTEARSAGLAAPSAKCRTAAMIDDIVMRVSKATENLDRLVEYIVHKYSCLAFKISRAKTIISTSRCIFLNRVYYKRREIPTACKIFARVDVPRNTQWRTVFDDIDAIYTGLQGSSHRGADPIASYAVACLYAIASIAPAAGWHGVETRSRSNTWAALVGFTPRSMGGWGIVPFCHFLVKCVAQANDMSLATLFNCVYQTSVLPASSLLCEVFSRYVTELLKIPLAKRDPISVINDPFGVRHQDTESPEVAVVGAMRALALKMCKVPSIARAIRATDNDVYVGAVDSFLKSHHWPAPVLATFADSLPHAIGQAVTASLSACERVARKMPPMVSKRLRIKVSKASTAAVLKRITLAKRCFTVQELRGPRARPWVMECSASKVMEATRIVSCDIAGYHFTHLAVHDPSDYLGHSVTSGLIGTSVPRKPKDGYFDPPADATFRASHTSRSIFEVVGYGTRDPHFFARAWVVASTAFAALMALEDEGAATCLWNFWQATLVGDARHLLPLGVVVDTTNVARMCRDTARRTHMPMVPANAWSQVGANANRIHDLWDETEHRPNWMDAVYYIKAIAVGTWLMSSKETLASYRDKTLSFIIRNPATYPLGHLQFIMAGAVQNIDRAFAIESSLADRADAMASARAALPQIAVDPIEDTEVLLDVYARIADGVLVTQDPQRVEELDDRLGTKYLIDLGDVDIDIAALTPSSLDLAIARPIARADVVTGMLTAVRSTMVRAESDVIRDVVRARPAGLQLSRDVPGEGLRVKAAETLFRIVATHAKNTNNLDQIAEDCSKEPARSAIEEWARSHATAEARPLPPWHMTALMGRNDADFVRAIRTISASGLEDLMFHPSRVVEFVENESAKVAERMLDIDFAWYTQMDYYLSQELTMCQLAGYRSLSRQLANDTMTWESMWRAILPHFRQWAMALAVPMYAWIANANRCRETLPDLSVVKDGYEMRATLSGHCGHVPRDLESNNEHLMVVAIARAGLDRIATRHRGNALNLRNAQGFAVNWVKTISFGADCRFCVRKIRNNLEHIWKDLISKLIFKNMRTVAVAEPVEVIPAAGTFEEELFAVFGASGFSELEAAPADFHDAPGQLDIANMSAAEREDFAMEFWDDWCLESGVLEQYQDASEDVVEEFFEYLAENGYLVRNITDVLGA